MAFLAHFSFFLLTRDPVVSLARQYFRVPFLAIHAALQCGLRGRGGGGGVYELAN